MIRAVLFDVDDTLVDYKGAERRGIAAHFQACGVDCDLGMAQARWAELQDHHYNRYLLGQTDYVGQATALATDMIAWLGLAGVADPYAWFLGYREQYERSLELFDDVTDCLETLDGILLGIVTNSTVAYTRIKLGRVGLLDRFPCLVGVDTVGAAKPDPVIFQAACSSIGVPPDAAAYVGDKLDSDALAACAAGLRGIWLNRANDGAGGIPDLRTFRAAIDMPEYSPLPAARNPTFELTGR